MWQIFKSKNFTNKWWSWICSKPFLDDISVRSPEILVRIHTKICQLNRWHKTNQETSWVRRGQPKEDAAATLSKKIPSLLCFKGRGKMRHWPASTLSTPLLNLPYLPLPDISTFSRFSTKCCNFKHLISSYEPLTGQNDQGRVNIPLFHSLL